MTAATPASAEFWRDPKLAYVESRRACHSRACYKPHSHPTLSIGAVDAGQSCFTGLPTGPVILQPGTVVFVPADTVHSCNPLPDAAWSYQMLHLDADWLQALWQETSGVTRCELTLANDVRLYARFCRLNAVLFSQVSAPEKEAELIEFLGDWVNAAQIDEPPPDHVRRSCAQLQLVLDQLRRQALGQASLAELAKVAGMNRYQLIRAFRAATGLTPHAYQLNQRINQARVGLRLGEPLADMAYRLGFADQGHFQRVFKAHVGVTPGRYRA